MYICNFYGDNIDFIASIYSWSYHGGAFRDATDAGAFSFSRTLGAISNYNGSRLFVNIL